MIRHANAKLYSQSQLAQRFRCPRGYRALAVHDPQLSAVVILIPRSASVLLSATKPARDAAVGLRRSALDAVVEFIDALLEVRTRSSLRLLDALLGVSAVVF